MVCNRSFRFRERQLTRTEYVDCARAWADALVWNECRGPGEIASARARVAVRYGIPARLLKDLKYRPPKRIAVEIFERLRVAYLTQVERQVSRFERELADASTHGAADTSLIRAASFVARAASRKAKRD